MRSRRKIERVGDILKRILPAHPLLVWSNVVGKEIASHTRPFSLKQGRLTVLVENSAYIQEFSLSREKIKEQLNKKLKEELIKEIVFRIGEIK